MKTSFKIGEVSGIPVRLHITLLFIIGFVAWSVASNIFQIAELIGVDPSAISPGSESYLIGLTLAIGLFVSVFVHEVAHSLVAKGMGVKIQEISLWLFGGVSNMEEIPEEPNLEIQISVVGPLTSIGIGVICYLVGSLIPYDSLIFIFLYLGFINVLLAAFNLIPAFPMDGGRLLRALLAKRKSYVWTTQTAASVGKAFALVMGILGIFYNPFLIIIAFFVFIGANQESQGIIVRSVLRKAKVEDVMTRDVKTIPPDMRLDEFLEYMWKVQHTGFPVVVKDEIVGIITLEDVKNVDRNSRDELTVRDVMEERVISFSPEDNVYDVWRKMTTENVGRFPVISEGRLVGIITRSDIMNSFQLLSEIEERKGQEI